MANTYTDNMSDGTILTDAQIDTALTSLKPSLDNTDLLTASASANQVLTATTPGAAATWQTPSPNVVSQGATNYGLAAIVSANQLVISLTNLSGVTPTTTTYPTINTPIVNTSPSSFKQFNITSARSITIPASASLGWDDGAGGATCYVNVYAIATSTSASGVRLAVSGQDPVQTGGSKFVSTTQIGTSSEAFDTVYATAAFSTKPICFLGRVKASIDISDNWSTVDSIEVGPVEVNPPLLSAVGSTVASASSTSSSFVTFASVTWPYGTSNKLHQIGLKNDNSSGNLICRIGANGSTVANGRFRIVVGTSTANDATCLWQGTLTADANGNSFLIPPQIMSASVSPTVGQTYTFQYKIAGLGSNVSATNVIPYIQQIER